MRQLSCRGAALVLLSASVSRAEFLRFVGSDQATVYLIGSDSSADVKTVRTANPSELGDAGVWRREGIEASGNSNGPHYWTTGTGSYGIAFRQDPTVPDEQAKVLVMRKKAASGFSNWSLPKVDFAIFTCPAGAAGDVVKEELFEGPFWLCPVSGESLEYQIRVSETSLAESGCDKGILESVKSPAPEVKPFPSIGGRLGKKVPSSGGKKLVYRKGNDFLPPGQIQASTEPGLPPVQEETVPDFIAIKNAPVLRKDDTGYGYHYLPKGEKEEQKKENEKKDRKIAAEEQRSEWRQRMEAFGGPNLNNLEGLENLLAATNVLIADQMREDPEGESEELTNLQDFAAELLRVIGDLKQARPAKNKPKPAAVPQTKKQAPVEVKPQGGDQAQLWREVQWFERAVEQNLVPQPDRLAKLYQLLLARIEHVTKNGPAEELETLQTLQASIQSMPEAASKREEVEQIRIEPEAEETIAPQEDKKLPPNPAKPVRFGRDRNANVLTEEQGKALDAHREYMAAKRQKENEKKAERKAEKKREEVPPKPEEKIEEAPRAEVQQQEENALLQQLPRLFFRDAPIRNIEWGTDANEVKKAKTAFKKKADDEFDEFSERVKKGGRPFTRREVADLKDLRERLHVITKGLYDRAAALKTAVPGDAIDVITKYNEKSGELQAAIEAADQTITPESISKETAEFVAKAKRPGIYAAEEYTETSEELKARINELLVPLRKEKKTKRNTEQIASLEGALASIDEITARAESAAVLEGIKKSVKEVTDQTDEGALKALKERIVKEIAQRKSLKSKSEKDNIDALEDMKAAIEKRIAVVTFSNDFEAWHAQVEEYRASPAENVESEEGRALKTTLLAEHDRLQHRLPELPTDVGSTYLALLTQDKASLRALEQKAAKSNADATSVPADKPAKKTQNDRKKEKKKLEKELKEAEEAEKRTAAALADKDAYWNRQNGKAAKEHSINTDDRNPAVDALIENLGMSQDAKSWPNTMKRYSFDIGALVEQARGIEAMRKLMAIKDPRLALVEDWIRRDLELKKAKQAQANAAYRAEKLKPPVIWSEEHKAERGEFLERTSHYDPKFLPEFERRIKERGFPADAPRSQIEDLQRTLDIVSGRHPNITPDEKRVEQQEKFGWLLDKYTKSGTAERPDDFAKWAFKVLENWFKEEKELEAIDKKHKAAFMSKRRAEEELKDADPTLTVKRIIFWLSAIADRIEQELEAGAGFELRDQEDEGIIRRPDLLRAAADFLKGERTEEGTLRSPEIAPAGRLAVLARNLRQRCEGTEIERPGVRSMAQRYAFPVIKHMLEKKDVLLKHEGAAGLSDKEKDLLEGIKQALAPPPIEGQIAEGAEGQGQGLSKGQKKNLKNKKKKQAAAAESGIANIPAGQPSAPASKPLEALDKLLDVLKQGRVPRGLEKVKKDAQRLTGIKGQRLDFSKTDNDARNRLIDRLTKADSDIYAEDYYLAQQDSRKAQGKGKSSDFGDVLAKLGIPYAESEEEYIPYGVSEEEYIPPAEDRKDEDSEGEK